jgi:putative ABC transport system permease protein
MEAVIGSDVAAKYPRKLGDKIVGAHGLTNSDDLHTDSPYTIVGILKPTGTVLDRLVLTPVESIWHVHGEEKHHDHEKHAHKKEHNHEEHHDHEKEHHKDKGKEITALLISYQTPMAAVQLPRMINKTSSMQAASPAFEVARLTKITGTGSDVLSVFGVLLIGFAAFGFFVTLYNAINERRYDIALMRALGATKAKIVTFIIAEVVTLTACGLAFGFILTHVFMYAVQYWVQVTKHMTLDPIPLFGKTEAIIAAIVLIGSLIAGLIPSIKAYRISITKTLVQS